MPRPRACRISDAAAICTATEMRCMTKGMYFRVAHVASRSNSACVSRFERSSAALRMRPSVLGPSPPQTSTSSSSASSPALMARA